MKAIRGNMISRNGFSLLELIVVLAVMAVLTGLGSSAGKAVQNWMAHQQTRTLFLEIMTACRMYRAEHGDWPPGADGGVAEITADGSPWRRALQPHLERNIEDSSPEDGFGNRRIFLVVDVDGDRWIDLSGVGALGGNERPGRIAGRVAAFSISDNGHLAAGSWEYD